MKKERNYYLIGLPVFGAVFIAFLVYMIRIAMQNPVEMDSSYMMPYMELDKNYNQIVESEKKFDEKFIVVAPKLQLTKELPANLELNITDKNGAAVDANITALITRPDTSKYDIKIVDFSRQATSYISKPFNVPLEGRWKIVYKIEAGGFQKFIDFETFVKKAK